MKILIQTLFFLLFSTQICLGQWVQIGLSNENIVDIEVKDSDIFVVASEDGNVFHSSDNGSSWNMIVESNANDIEIYQSGKLFLVKDDSLYYSSNNGEAWANTNMNQQIADSLPFGFSKAIKIFLSSQGTIFCHIGWSNGICYNDGFAHSTDNGITWVAYNPFLSGRLFAFRNEFILTSGFASCIGGSGGSGFYLSSDYGNTWELDSIIIVYTVLEFFSKGNIITYGADYNSFHEALYMSLDTCNSWIEIDTLSCQVGTSISNGSSEYLMVGTEDLGVFLYSDDGSKIGEINEGLINLNVQALTSDNNGYVYAGTENGLWRRPLSEITSVVDNSTALPSEFLLLQNYPNPFNPNTKIKYSVPQASQVQIKVFDVLGNEIETLVNEEKSAGTYEINWYAEQLPSGVYFYQLKAGNLIQMKKMVLLK